MATGQTDCVPSQYRVFRDEDFDDMREVDPHVPESEWHVAVDRVTGCSVRIWRFGARDVPGYLSRVLSFYSKMHHPKMCPILGYGMDRHEGWLVIKSFHNGSLTEMLQKERDGKAPPEWNDTARAKVIWGVAMAMAWFDPDGDEFGVRLTTDEIMLDENFEPTVMPVLSGPGEDMIRFGFDSLLYDREFSVFSSPEIVGEERDPHWTMICVYQFAWVLYLIFAAKSGTVTVALKSSLKKDVVIDLLRFGPARMPFLIAIQQGWRPERMPGIPESYWELINYAWSQDERDRPSFWSIVHHITDPDTALPFPKADVQALREYESRLFCPLNFDVDLVDAVLLEKLRKLSHLFSSISHKEQMDFLQKLRVDLNQVNPTDVQGLVMIAYAIAVAREKPDVARKICVRTLGCSNHIIQYLSCFVGMNKTSDDEKAIIKRITDHSRNGNPFCRKLVTLHEHGTNIIELLSVDSLMASTLRCVDSPYFYHFSETIRDFKSIFTLDKPIKLRYGTIEVAIDGDTLDVYSLASIPDGDRFRDTLEVLVRAQHPCVITIFGTCLPTRSHCGRILLEYHRGGEFIYQLLNWAVDSTREDGKYRDNVKFYVSLSVCRLIMAMRFLHSRGITHGHLDPENIVFLQGKGVPWLMVSGLGALEAPTDTDDYRRRATDDIYHCSRAVIMMITSTTGQINADADSEGLKKSNVKPEFSSLLMRDREELPSFDKTFWKLRQMEFNIFESLPGCFRTKLLNHMLEMLKREPRK